MKLSEFKSRKVRKIFFRSTDQNFLDDRNKLPHEPSSSTQSWRDDLSEASSSKRTACSSNSTSAISYFLRQCLDKSEDVNTHLQRLSDKNKEVILKHLKRMQQQHHSELRGIQDTEILKRQDVLRDLIAAMENNQNKDITISQLKSELTKQVDDLEKQRLLQLSKTIELDKKRVAHSKDQKKVISELSEQVKKAEKLFQVKQAEAEVKQQEFQQQIHHLEKKQKCTQEQLYFSGEINMQHEMTELIQNSELSFTDDQTKYLLSKAVIKTSHWNWKSIAQHHKCKNLMAAIENNDMSAVIQQASVNTGWLRKLGLDQCFFHGTHGRAVFKSNRNWSLI